MNGFRKRLSTPILNSRFYFFYPDDNLELVRFDLVLVSISFSFRSRSRFDLVLVSISFTRLVRVSASCQVHGPAYNAEIIAR